MWAGGNCRLCHEIEEPLFSHPVEVRPSMPVPEHLPLQAGRVTCTTCHLDDLAAHGRSRQAHDAMLRADSGPGGFCRQCHATIEGDARASHGLALGRAHLQSMAPSMAFEDTVSTQRQSVETAQNCLSCHDGTVARGLGNSHPVGVRYGRTRHIQGRRPRLNLTPPDRLDRRVRLFEGDVQCGSCHSPFSSLKKLLVMSNEGDRLCKSCHRMR